MQNFYRLWNWFAPVLLIMAISSAQATPAIVEDPYKVVTETIDALFVRLNNNVEAIHNDPQIAYQISNELIAPHIDFPRVTRLVIGKYWRSADDAQRQQLIAEVRELLIRSYVTVLTSYIDQILAHKDHINFLPSRYKPGDRKASVRARLHLGSGQQVEIHYQVYYTNNEWKIYDIRIEGISLAITYRTSFAAIIKREGLNALIAKLEAQNINGEVELPGSISAPFASSATLP